MGTRGQVYFPEEKVYLYQHYDSYELPNIVRAALIRGRGRWNDPEYLARIVFSEMIRDDIDGTTGYGIGYMQHGDIEYLITLHTDTQRIVIKHLYGETNSYSFEAFVNDTKTEW